MTWRALPLTGAFEHQPAVFGDERGFFFEAFSNPRMTTGTGAPFAVAQVNVSQSSRGTIRGVHYADVPPGQAKWVQCLAGEVLDVLVDLRVGSPTFGQWEAVRLTAAGHNAVLIPAGFGHAFQALSDTALVMYCVDHPYTPDAEHELHPLDPDLGLPWEPIAPLLSPKDAAAPGLAELVAAGTLPTLEACQSREPARD